MSELIDKSELIKALNKVAMKCHERHVPMVEHDFRELINNAKVVDITIDQNEKQYAKEFEAERNNYE